MKKTLLIFISLCVIITSIFLPYSAFGSDIYQNNDLRRVSVHDPSLFKANNGKYYVVGSHLVMGESDDMVNWNDLGYSLDGENYLCVNGKSWKENLAEPLEWTTRYQLSVPEKYDPNNLEYNCWAHDIIYNEAMGKYCLYGAVSVWGATSSVIWLAVGDSPTGPFEYKNSLVYSGITNLEIQKYYNQTNNIDGVDSVIEALDYHNSNLPELIEAGYVNESYINMTRDSRPYKWFTYWGAYDCGWGTFPNAIDPTIYTDKSGEMWLVYGSYSGGCYVLKINNQTGLPDYEYMKNHDGFDIYFGKQISKTNAGTEGTGEGPYIVYDNLSGYYYLFLTYGGLAGDGGYNIREYRSKNPDGPFEDAMGNLATDDKNTGLKLDGNYQFSTQPTAYLSGGHSSCIVDDDGTMYQAYHTRFTADDGNGHQLRIHQMLRTSDGWAVLLPYEYQGERVSQSGYDKDDIVGVYEFVDTTNMTHRKAEWQSPWSDIILPTQYIRLNADGTITGARDYTCSNTSTNTGAKWVSGSWSVKDKTYQATFKLGSVTYNGVFCLQKDESKSKNEVMTFAGAGSDNSTIWAVKDTQNHTVETEPTSSTTKKVTTTKKATTTQKATTTKKQTTTKKKVTTTKKITVKAAKLSSVKAGKKSFTANWKKVSGVTGYQVQYATDKKFKKNKKTVTISKNKTTKTTVKKLKAKKKYYVRIRAYKTVSGKKYYSSWSGAKTVTTKK